MTHFSYGVLHFLKLQYIPYIFQPLKKIMGHQIEGLNRSILALALSPLPTSTALCQMLSLCAPTADLMCCLGKYRKRHLFV